MKNYLKTCCLGLTIILIAASFFSFTGLQINVYALQRGYVNGTYVRVRKEPDTSNDSNILGMLSNVYVTIIGSKNGSDGKLWYNINYNDTTGYIHSDFITQVENIDSDPSFEKQLESFPESYRDSLKSLHALYPKWNFYAEQIDLTLDKATDLELTHKQINKTAGLSWRSMGVGGYNWDSNTWVDNNGGYCAASRELIKYYIDPRSFLNQTDIFTYMQLMYKPESQTEQGLAKLIKGTFLEKNYSDPNDTAYGGSYIKVIMEAAKQSQISPYHLASTILQEQGTQGTSSMISGTTSYGKVYNFFNVNASGANTAEVIKNGLTYAINSKWTTRSASIIGGANFCGKSYVSQGQNTYFYMNYNLKNPSKIYHQYAQAVYNAVSSGKFISKTYLSLNDEKIDFVIPVLKSMPSKATAIPANNNNLNNYYFNSINVPGLTPTYTRFNYEYDLSVKGNTTICVSLPENATYSGNKSFILSPGNNRILLPVKSQSGYFNNYYVNIILNSSSTCTLTVDTGGGSGSTSTKILNGDTNGDGKVSLIDLANVQRHLLSLITLKGDNFTGADTNHDGKISLIDLANIQRHLLGIINLN